MPDKLRSVRDSNAAGPSGRRNLRQTEDEAIKELVSRQIDLGLSEVTSGEFRRDRWDKDFWFGLMGVQRERIESGRVYQTQDTFTDTIRLTGRISYNPEHPFFDDYSFLEKTADGRAICRQTLPSPANLYLHILTATWLHTEQINQTELLDDIAEAYNKTILHFYRLGCRSLQLDDTACTRLCHDSEVKRLLQGGIDIIALQKELIELHNNTVTGVPSDMEISMHLSGYDTVRPEWLSDRLPESIMPKVLAQVNVNRFYLPVPADDQRHLGILRYMPAGKHVVLGLTDACSLFMDDPSVIHPTIDMATGIIPSSRISVSPRTGFKVPQGTFHGLTYEAQWIKLEQLKNALYS